MLVVQLGRLQIPDVRGDNTVQQANSRGPISGVDLAQTKASHRPTTNGTSNYPAGFTYHREVGLGDPWMPRRPIASVLLAGSQARRLKRSGTSRAQVVGRYSPGWVNWDPSPGMRYRQHRGSRGWALESLKSQGSLARPFHVAGEIPFAKLSVTS